LSDLLLPWQIYPLFFLVALMYSSVGHGGASGYLALFALVGATSPSIAPIALVLNILVATTSFLRYKASGYFSLRLLLPFIILSIPAAFVGGAISIPQRTFSALLGAALIAGALRIFFLGGVKNEKKLESALTHWAVGLILGGGLGLLSGMTGIGGGVFLSPLLLLMGWADVKQTAATSSAFIVANSVSGLAGHLTRTSLDIAVVAPLAVTVIAGGALGSYVGAAQLRPKMLQIVLAIVLLTAGGKLLLKVL
jgi:uncharacterized membrane protein YfcA